MTLLVAPCGRDAAVHAVTTWHYSRVMPVGRSILYGVWEDDAFIGAVVFARGASPQLLDPYGLKQTEGCELARVALTTHRAPVSQIVAAALRRLRTSNPGLRLVLSFADPERGHHGGIYQAGGWLYLGTTSAAPVYRVNGRVVHERMLSDMILASHSRRRTDESRLAWCRRVLDPNAERRSSIPKHRYAMPFTRSLRRTLLPFTRPYPPAVEGSTVIRPSPWGDAGSTPADRSA